MTGRYPVPAEEVRAETEVSKSRFLAVLVPAASEEAAHDLVRQLREAHPEASHHCYAFLVGAPGTSRSVGFSDDGEPHGTAGRPMLDVLSHSGLGDLACVVVRWFGGTKLGKGGLVRAYGGAVEAALELVERAEKIDWISATLAVPYEFVGGLERLFAELEVETLDREFGGEVRWTVRLPQDRRAHIEVRLEEATLGRVGLRFED